MSKKQAESIHAQEKLARIVAAIDEATLRIDALAEKRQAEEKRLDAEIREVAVKAAQGEASAASLRVDRSGLRAIDEEIADLETFRTSLQGQLADAQKAADLELLEAVPGEFDDLAERFRQAVEEMVRQQHGLVEAYRRYRAALHEISGACGRANELARRCGRPTPDLPINLPPVHRILGQSFRPLEVGDPKMRHWEVQDFILEPSPVSSLEGDVAAAGDVAAVDDAKDDVTGDVSPEASLVG